MTKKTTIIISETAESTMVTRDMIRNLKKLKEAKKVIDARIAEVTAEIEEKAAECGVSSFDWSDCGYTISETMTNSFDKKRFVYDHPGMLDDYMKVSHGKRLTTR